MRRLLFAFLAILLGFLTALAWYAYDRGLTRRWRDFLVSQFTAKGFEVSFKRVTLNPFRGLIGEEVRVYDAHNHHRVIAIVDEVLLGVNYASAARRKNFLDSVVLRDARVSLPLDPGDPHSETVNIDHLNARLFFPEKQIYVSHAEAEINGVVVTATGRLINPPGWNSAVAGEWSPGAVFAPMAAALKQLRYEDERPRLSIEFSGDLTRPQRIAAQVRLHASDVRRKRYRIDEVDLAANCRAGIAEIEQLDVADSRGELHACGSYNLLTGQFFGRVQSTLDLQALDKAFGPFPILNDFVLRDPPKIDLQARGATGAPGAYVISGKLEATHVLRGSEDYRRVAADVLVENDRWAVRNLQIEHRSGSILGDLMQTPDEIRGRMRGSIDPSALAFLVTGKPAEWLAQLRCNEPASFSLELKGSAATLEQCTASGEIQFSQATFAGHPVSGRSSALFTNGVLTLNPFPPDGRAWKTAFDLHRNEIRTERPEDEPKEGDEP